MYFLSHTYTLLKALPKNIPKEMIAPMIIGSWAPDAGYFPLFSWQLRQFKHSEKPTIALYRRNSLEDYAYTIGWKAHILSDKIIHARPFFDDNTPLCPVIPRNKGTKVLLLSAKKHLGREVGLDLFICEHLLSKDDIITKTLFKKETYLTENITNSGFTLLQKYIYAYVTKFLGLLKIRTITSKKILKFIDYEFFFDEKTQQQTINLLEKIIDENKKLISENITNQ
ncbi:MAG: zinc dependent phospholipase C family protein [Asgard group archaeon]|nr:zinc dependent phospholipase C family protein [Asgard group archaeon]